MKRFAQMINEIANCYWLYRCLLIIDLPPMIEVPIKVLMHEHVSDARFLNSFLCWCFAILCWKTCGGIYYLHLPRKVVNRMSETLSDWEIFHVTYRLPKFGSDTEFQDETHEMMISTRGGRTDAKAACKQYHHGCKIEQVRSGLEVAANIDLTKPMKKGVKRASR